MSSLRPLHMAQPTKLVIFHRAEHQLFALCENVLLIMRWLPIVEADIAIYHRAMATLHSRHADGIAFLQVNRFDPAKTVRVEESISTELFKVMSAHQTSLRILALTMLNAPMVTAGIRVLWSRMVLTTKVRLNYHVFDELH